jgi:exodeoxyribonuclease-1
LLQAIADDRLRKLGKRLIFVERPDLFSETERAATNIAIARRLSNDEAAAPWKTLGQALREADDLLEHAIGDESVRLKQHRAYLAAQLENAMRLCL